MQKCSSEAVPPAVVAVRCRRNEYVGYIRVSSKQQEREGDSLECQLDQIQAYASAKGAELLRVFEDAASAFNSGSSTRPGLCAAIDEALRVGVPLLVPSIDRLSRSLKDLTLLHQKGLSIHSADRKGFESCPYGPHRTSTSRERRQGSENDPTARHGLQKEE
ncbi:recombinase family protein [Nioella sp.]|uniref:recombinase family protein n=1 Tax=Nioella sp. TaxID=1912091 RepID=UPI003A87CB8A